MNNTNEWLLFITIIIVASYFFYIGTMFMTRTDSFFWKKDIDKSQLQNFVHIKKISE